MPDSQPSVRQCFCRRMLESIQLLILYSFLFWPLSSNSQELKSLQQYKFDHFTTQEGLLHPVVRDIIQDQYGFLWFATDQGLNRYDGYEFKKFPEENDSIELNTSIRDLTKGEKDNIWIGSLKGLYEFNLKTNQLKPIILNAEGQEKDAVICLTQSKNGILWIGTTKGVKCYNPKSGEVVAYKKKDNVNYPFSKLRIEPILEDTSGILWIGTREGLNKYDPATGENTIYLHNPQDDSSIGADGIGSLMQDKNGTIWIGTLNGGLNKYIGNNKFQHYIHNPKDPQSIASNRVTSLLEDEGSLIWIGLGDQELNIFNSQTETFEHYPSNEDDPTSIGPSTIWNILRDNSGIYWFAQHGIVSKLDPLKNVFVNHKHQTNNPQSLSHNTTLAIAESDTRDIWVGTWGGGLNRYNPYSQRFERVAYQKDNANSILESRVRRLHAGSNTELWISHFSGKLTQFDGQRYTLFNYNPDAPDRSGMSPIGLLTEDEQGNLWYGNEQGIIRIHLISNDYKYFQAIDDISIKNLYGILKTRDGQIWVHGEGGLAYFDLSSNVFKRVDSFEQNLSIQSIFEDENETLWLGVEQLGLVQYDVKNNTSLTFGKKEGLTNSQIMCIREDDKGILWLSTNGGIFSFDKENKKFSSYYVSDGLPDNAFLMNSCCKSKHTGRLYFGGVKGFTEFHPDSLKANEFSPPIRFTKMRKYSDQNVMEEITLLGRKEIQLDYHDQLITFEFAILDFHNPLKHKYRYQLQGQSDIWIELDNKHDITFAKLDPGNYELHIAGINDKGTEAEPAKLSIDILPPWWRTSWAYLFFAAVAFSLIYAVYRFQLNRQITKAEMIKLKELDEAKTRLYTNITHEFRTPLTIILGMAQRVQTDSRAWLDEGIQMIQHSGKNLLNLVNQMLDLAKLESGRSNLKLIQGNIISYLQYVVESFHSLAEMKNINLQFTSTEQTVLADYDPDNLLKIISNLISNAIKFTESNGEVAVHVSPSNSEEHQTFLEIVVSDTGVGIPQDKLPHVFDRFYQVDNSPTRSGEGTGIGLALTKELVKLMDGKIAAKSTLGEGSEFRLSLPIRTEAPVVNTVDQVSINDNLMTTVTSHSRKIDFQVPANTNGENPTLLIVEDNIDVIKYLFSCLEDSYQLEVAYNGAEGIEKAIALVPDIIISDVMMPIKDGFELCDTLKNDQKTSHIPIVLLTAKADIDSKIAGLKRGADAYLPKPFNKEELLVQLDNLVKLRQKLQMRYQDAIPTSVDLENPFVSMEDAFLLKIKDIVEENLNKADFDINWLAQQMHMSRVQLFRKIKALTDKSPSMFVRSIRLQKAKTLLLSTTMNISEITYDVGFSNPAFFSRIFRDEFGKSPTEMREEFFG